MKDVWMGFCDSVCYNKLSSIAMSLGLIDELPIIIQDAALPSGKVALFFEFISKNPIYHEAMGEALSNCQAYKAIEYYNKNIKL